MEKQYKRPQHFIFLRTGNETARAELHRIIEPQYLERSRIMRAHWWYEKTNKYHVKFAVEQRYRYLGRAWEHFTWKLFFRDWL